MIFLRKFPQAMRGKKKKLQKYIEVNSIRIEKIKFVWNPDTSYTIKCGSNTLLPSRQLLHREVNNSGPGQFLVGCGGLLLVCTFRPCWLSVLWKCS